MLSGVPAHATVVGAFALMGPVVAVTGFMQTAYAGASTTTVGSLMELGSVAACVMVNAATLERRKDIIARRHEPARRTRPRAWRPVRIGDHGEPERHDADGDVA